jgi:cytochrome c oxidase subunit 2
MRESARVSAHTRRTRWTLAALLAAMAVLTSGCATGELPQDVLGPEGPVARKLDRLWDPVFGIAVVIFFLVEFLVVFVVIRYRAKGDDDAPKQIHGNTRLELAWTIAPALILAFVGVFTVGTIFDINRRAVGADVVTVKLTGHQWWWEYEYPDLHIVTANELHIPVGRSVQLDMTSKDVIHSYWPPKLAGKVDVVPGRTNHMQIKADHPGTYWGQCTEYCGLSHGYMRLRVIAHDAAGWDAWVASEQRDAAEPPASNADAVAGKALVSAKGCSGCHTINGYQGVAGKVGPNLTHLASRKRFAGATFDVNERNLRKWLRNPPAMKPMNPANGQGMPNLGLTEDEITKLIAYLETLK